VSTDGLLRLGREKNRTPLLVDMQRFSMGIFASECQAFQWIYSFYLRFLSRRYYLDVKNCLEPKYCTRCPEGCRKHLRCGQKTFGTLPYMWRAAVTFCPTPVWTSNCPASDDPLLRLMQYGRFAPARFQDLLPDIPN